MPKYELKNQKSSRMIELPLPERTLYYPPLSKASGDVEPLSEDEFNHRRTQRLIDDRKLFVENRIDDEDQDEEDESIDLDSLESYSESDARYDELMDKDYSEVQEIAQYYGIQANQSHNELADLIIEFETEVT